MDTPKGHSEDPPVTIFINYMKSEAGMCPRFLYDALAKEFGAENVFFDEESLQAGVKWSQDIRSGSAGCTAFLALVGPDWAANLKKRKQGGAEDYVSEEIEAALDGGVRTVIPVLIEEAPPPSKEALGEVGPPKRLFNHQWVKLGRSSWDADVKALIEKLKQSAAAGEPPAAPTESPQTAPAERVEPDSQTAAPAAAASLAAPARSHCDEIARLMLKKGSLVVPFLGPGVNSCERTKPWQDPDSGSLPDSEELAGYLASELDAPPTPASLASISQQLFVASPASLYIALREALPPRRAPGPVHRSLAELPAKLRSRGGPDPYQLIVTTNYDNALERAFEDAEEDYDLAVYVAQGEDKGKFFHITSDGKSHRIDVPNTYTDFPIDEIDQVERTVIMKIHGAINPLQGRPPWSENNYVITEDDYIGYMSDGAVESIVPQQLLRKLRSYSHFLFLGHEMHDWSLRVFLIRIFGGAGKPNNPSWAVEPEPTPLDEEFWQRIDVNLTVAPLDAYLTELGNSLAGEDATAQSRS
ncbi:MAG: SIR2 family protein [Solirubrobacterales bacterium]